MPHNKILRSATVLLLTLIMLLQSGTVFAASPSDVASGTDTAVTSPSDEAGDVSSGDVSDTDAPVDLNLGTVKAKAALLIDLNTQEVLYEQNADEALPPASTTKIMTALLVLDAVAAGQISLDENVVADSKQLSSVPWDASTVNPRVANGEIMTVRDMLYCIMLTSDCAVCNVLANRVSGSVDDFVERMNTRAAELGCTGVNFVNTHGYPAEGHVASARSLYLITQAAMNYPEFAEIVSARRYTIPATNKNAERLLTNTNALMVGASNYRYLYATGVKTGYSKSSGYCLVSTAEKADRRLMSVVLGAEKVPDEDGVLIYEHFTESKRLLEWGFNAFAWQTIAHAGFSVTEVPLSGGELSYLTLVYAESAVAMLPVDFDVDTIEKKINLRLTSAAAPVTKGDNYGTVTLVLDGKELASIPLIAGGDAPVKETMSPTVWYAVICGAVLAVVCLIMAIRQALKRRDVYGYDPVPDPVGDPNTYRYGERPLYNRRGRNVSVARPSYNDGMYYTRREEPDEDYYAYEEYRQERERNRRAAYEQKYAEPRQPSQPGPVFPKNWKPPERRQ